MAFRRSGVRTPSAPPVFPVIQAALTSASFNWLCTGREVFPAMLEAIEAARQSVDLEMYTFAPGALAERFGQALLASRQRGIRVRVLLDAIGSINLPSAFWKPLRALGGEVRQFNPLALGRFGIRDHRKLLVCDEKVAFVGGFNIASEYDGDGVTRGWCDVGLKIEGPLATELAASFEEMFVRADFRHRRFVRLRKTSARKTVPVS